MAIAARATFAAIVAAALTKIKENWRVLQLSAWLGWQLESNWADPLLFLGYIFVKPVASSLILLVMYLVVTRGSTTAPAFAQMYVGNAFFAFVGQVLFGVSWVIAEDREHFATLKYVYISRVRLFWYLLGRAGAKFAITSISTGVLLLFGRYALGVPLHAAGFRPAYFVTVFVLGIVSCIGAGLFMAGVMLVAARNAGGYAEALAGLFYLASGALFPIDVLPRWLQAASLTLPFTYWIEGLKRALLGASTSARLSALGDPALLWRLALGTAATMALGAAAFRFAEHVARRRGLLDMRTES